MLSKNKVNRSPNFPRAGKAVFKILVPNNIKAVVNVAILFDKNSITGPIGTAIKFIRLVATSAKAAASFENTFTSTFSIALNYFSCAADFFTKMHTTKINNGNILVT